MIDPITRIATAPTICPPMMTRLTSMAGCQLSAPSLMT